MFFPGRPAAAPLCSSAVGLGYASAALRIGARLLCSSVGELGYALTPGYPAAALSNILRGGGAAGRIV